MRIYKMCEIQEGVKCYLFHIFTCFLWTHPLRSKPIIKRPFKCLKRSFGFQFQASSSICEQLMRAYPRSKKKSTFIDDLEIIAYWEESEWSEALANKCGSFRKQMGVGAVIAVKPQKNLSSFKTGNSFSRT